MRSPVRRFLAALADVAFALAVLAELAVCWFAVTAFLHGACALVAGGALGVRLVVRPVRGRRLRRGLGLLSLTLAAFGLVVVDVEFFRHVTRDEAQLQSEYLSSGGGGLLSVFNLVPEADVVSFGVKASGLLGLWPPGQMNEMHGLLMREYAAMRRAPGFAHVGNVAAHGLPSAAGGHFFRYLPRGYREERQWPLLVFLHGAGGNFALYPWLWRRFADEHGFVVLCPTWDNGLWDQPGGVQAALDALDDTLSACSVDGSRIFLAGLSNGGISGWAVLCARPEAFRGFISISGGLAAGRQPDKMKRVSVLLIHGAKDRIIPIDAPRKLRAALKREGVAVQLIEFPDDDHFLLLRSRRGVCDAVARWMRAGSVFHSVIRITE